MTDRLREFLHDEAAGGLAILAATIVALIWANSGLDYDGFWHTELGPLDLHHWVNDALMAVFFLVVGLEIKREVVDGRLQDPRTAALPALAAVGGVVAPIVIFVAIVAGGEGAEGWAIACATDIAFAVGLIALLGDRVSDGTPRVPARGRDRRRHHRHRDHRDLLRRGRVAAVAAGGGGACWW